MIKCFLAGFALVTLLVALTPGPAPAHAVGPASIEPTWTPGGPTFTPTNTRPPTRTPTPPPTPVPAPNWMQVGQTWGRGFGWSLSAAGDINGDGYGDVIIGQEVEPGGGSVVYLYYGSALGLLGSAAWSTDGDFSGSRYGSSLAAAGDLNDDGYGDIIIGEPNYVRTADEQGRAYIFYGTREGLTWKAGWTMTGEGWSAHFGDVVSAAGDINGDGYDDVVIGASGANSGLGYGQGKVYVWCGSAAGLGPTPCWTATGDQKKSSFGDGATGGVGDVNGDGYADILVSAPQYDAGETDEGRAYLYYGSPSGLGAQPDWKVEGDQAGAALGSGRPAAGDVNADGFDDIVVAAPHFDAGEDGEGRVYLFFGSPGGPAYAPAWTVDGEQAGAGLGLVAGTAGDLNADGYADLVVGSPQYDHGQPEEGAVWVYPGAANGPLPQPIYFIESNLAYVGLGSAVASAGDVDRDGRGDLAIGASNYDTENDNSGAAFAWYGAPGVLPVATQTATLTPTGAPSLTATFTVAPTSTPTSRATSDLHPTATPWPRFYLPLVTQQG